MSLSYNNYAKKKFKIKKLIEFNFYLNEDVFEPNLTSKLLIESVYATLNKKNGRMSILDLGCGCGVVGMALSLLTDKSNKFNFSDVSIKATSNAKINLKKLNIIGKIRTGSMFQQWTNDKFDLIIDDISAISSKVASLSQWFDNVSCESGDDGSLLTNKVLANSKKVLNKNGSIFIPILSLSNTEKIIECAKQKFKNVKLIKSIKWPLPEEMYKYKHKLEGFRNLNLINYSVLYDKIICETSIYKCYD